MKKNTIKYNYDRMNSPSKLYQGQCLISDSKTYYTILQPEGRLVIYVSSHFTPKNILYSTIAKGDGVGPYILSLQNDGNLQLHDSRNIIIWETCTTNQGKEPYQLIMRDSGKLQLVDFTENIIWESFLKEDIE